MVTQQKRRLYKLHYNLRKKGNTLSTRERWVVKRAVEVSPIEQRWLTELIGRGYCVSDDMFAPPHYSELEN